MFRDALTLCGLSQSDAARYLDASVPDIRSWCAGVGFPPDLVWYKLARLFEQIRTAASSAAELIDQISGDTLEVPDLLDVNLKDAPITPAASRRVAGTMAILMSMTARN